MSDRTFISFRVFESRESHSRKTESGFIAAGIIDYRPSTIDNCNNDKGGVSDTSNTITRIIGG